MSHNVTFSFGFKYMSDCQNNVFIWMPTIKTKYSLYSLSSVVLLCKFVGSGRHSKPQQRVMG